MSLILNRKYYVKLIREDIDWLEKNTEDDLERQHIIVVLEDSIDRLYPKDKLKQESKVEEMTKEELQNTKKEGVIR